MVQATPKEVGCNNKTRLVLTGVNSLDSSSNKSCSYTCDKSKVVMKKRRYLWALEWGVDKFPNLGSQ